jgi:hypothetical protein
VANIYPDSQKMVAANRDAVVELLQIADDLENERTSTVPVIADFKTFYPKMKSLVKTYLYPTHQMEKEGATQVEITRAAVTGLRNIAAELEKEAANWEQSHR